jgi:hypothetical protein
MLSATDILILAFSITNSFRVIAYMPQIIRLARDRSGAAAVSCSTWVLFFVSNLSTAAYGGLVLGDRWMSLIFTATAGCNLAIVILTLVRRRQQRCSCDVAKAPI